MPMRLTYYVAPILWAILITACATPGDMETPYEPELPQRNLLTEQERADGWLLLFDGKTLDGWMTSAGEESLTPVQDGAINPHKCGHYMMVYQEKWRDFILSLDFKMSPKCNSGVFFRTYSLETRPGKDVGFNGLEVAIDDTETAGYTDTGALYDLSSPTKNNMNPIGEWNRLVLTCDDNLIKVELNGEQVNEMDLDQWTQKNRRPDGTSHKFDTAYRNHPREGYIGLQDHGANIWFRNIKLKPLNVE